MAVTSIIKFQRPCWAIGVAKNRQGVVTHASCPKMEAQSAPKMEAHSDTKMEAHSDTKMEAHSGTKMEAHS